MSGDTLIAVAWPAPPAVRAFSSGRAGGVSRPPFASLNLSTATGDDAHTVARNVARLEELADLPHPLRWPRQVHGVRVVDAAEVRAGDVEADAVTATRPGLVCSVRSADCLPVLLCDREASCVAAAHAGWRGLAAGVLESCVTALPAPPGRLMAWLGPAIGQRAYEVGDEVRQAFLDHDARAASCFRVSPAGRWLADLAALARRRLQAVGVSDIHDCRLCTHDNPATFFSHRRDGPATGRQASGIWITADA